MAWLRSPLTPLLDFGSSEPTPEGAEQGSFMSWTFFSPSPKKAEPQEPMKEEKGRRRGEKARLVAKNAPCSCCPPGTCLGIAKGRTERGLSHLPSQQNDILHAHRRQGTEFEGLASFAKQWQQVESAAQLPELSTLDRGRGFQDSEPVTWSERGNIFLRFLRVLNTQ